MRTVQLKKRESFPFSILSRDSEDDQKDLNAQSDSASLSNCESSISRFWFNQPTILVRFPLNANSSSDSSGGSKRYDSDASTSSSIRESIRQKQKKTDEVFGFLEDEEDFTAAANIPIAEEIGPDLDAFVKELSVAPRSINSFSTPNDDMKLLNEQVRLYDRLLQSLSFLFQLEYFKQKAPMLDNFITSMLTSMPGALAEQDELKFYPHMGD